MSVLCTMSTCSSRSLKDYCALQHLRRLPSLGEFPGGNIMAESLIHVTNVSLVDPEDR